MNEKTFLIFIDSMLEKYNMKWEDFMLEPDEFEKKLLKGELESK